MRLTLASQVVQPKQARRSDKDAQYEKVLGNLLKVWEKSFTNLETFKKIWELWRSVPYTQSKIWKFFWEFFSYNGKIHSKFFIHIWDSLVEEFRQAHNAKSENSFENIEKFTT